MQYTPDGLAVDSILIPRALDGNECAENDNNAAASPDRTTNSVPGHTIRTEASASGRGCQQLMARSTNTRCKDNPNSLHAMRFPYCVNPFFYTVPPQFHPVNQPYVPSFKPQLLFPSMGSNYSNASWGGGSQPTNTTRPRRKRKKCQVPGCLFGNCPGGYNRASCFSLSPSQRIKRTVNELRLCRVKNYPNPEHWPGTINRSNCIGLQPHNK